MTKGLYKSIILITLQLLILQTNEKSECQIILDTTDGQEKGHCGSAYNRSTCQDGYCSYLGSCINFIDGSLNSKLYSSDHLPEECKRKGNAALTIILIVVIMIWVMPYQYQAVSIPFCTTGKIRERYKDFSCFCFYSLWLFPCTLIFLEFMRRNNTKKNRVVPIDAEQNNFNVAIQGNSDQVPQNQSARRSQYNSSSRVRSNRFHNGSRQNAENSEDVEEYSSYEEISIAQNNSMEQAFIQAIPANKPTKEEQKYKKKHKRKKIGMEHNNLTEFLSSSALNLQPVFPTTDMQRASLEPIGGIPMSEAYKVKTVYKPNKIQKAVAKKMIRKGDKSIGTSRIQKSNITHKKDAFKASKISKVPSLKNIDKSEDTIKTNLHPTNPNLKESKSVSDSSSDSA